MYQLKFQTTTLCLRNLMNRSSRHRGTVAALLLMLALGCFALSPTVRAVDPPPGGGYPNQNIAAGEDALFSLTTGADNTAMRFAALDSNTTGADNALASW